MGLLLFTLLFVSHVTAWPPAPALNIQSNNLLLLCPGFAGEAPAAPISVFLPAPTGTTVPEGLESWLFISADGAAWRAYDAALRAGLALPSVPDPAALSWSFRRSLAFLSGAPLPGPGVVFDTSWATSGDDSFASHAVVYVTALSDTPLANATVEGVAARAFFGAIASRLSPQDPACGLTAAHAAVSDSTAAVEQLINERLSALAPLPAPATPSASHVAAPLGNLEVNGASSSATALPLALALAAAAWAAAAYM